MGRTEDDPLAGRIFTIRGQRVVLDADLARLYEVTTRAFNQAIKRNAARFPEDFAFQISPMEFAAIRSQIATRYAETKDTEGVVEMWSRFVTTSKPHRRRHSNLPSAFTEHGAVMAANVLRSAKAVEMSIYVVRAFVRMREELMTNAEIPKRLAHIDRSLIEHDTALQELWKRLQPLLAPRPEMPKRRIGFQAGGD